MECASFVLSTFGYTLQLKKCSQLQTQFNPTHCQRKGRIRCFNFHALKKHVAYKVHSSGEQRTHSHRQNIESAVNLERPWNFRTKVFLSSFKGRKKKKSCGQKFSSL